MNHLGRTLVECFAIGDTLVLTAWNTARHAAVLIHQIFNY
ncbi:hypothetical protein HD593_005824 [Nonomuraea rubra]|uniref:Uncharacterized protein n=1 Tax=Nonomuraea rubra TaxID=46180 RepID=A0A7X0NX30_9ACTN|nr:hypothetical protein [Nonomuraea rubra]